MFNVGWEVEPAETVGQHRAKKLARRALEAELELQGYYKDRAQPAKKSPKHRQNKKSLWNFSSTTSKPKADEAEKPVLEEKFLKSPTKLFDDLPVPPPEEQTTERPSTHDGLAQFKDEPHPLPRKHSLEGLRSDSADVLKNSPSKPPRARRSKRFGTTTTISAEASEDESYGATINISGGPPTKLPPGSITVTEEITVTYEELSGDENDEDHEDNIDETSNRRTDYSSTEADKVQADLGARANDGLSITPAARAAFVRPKASVVLRTSPPIPRDIRAAESSWQIPAEWSLNSIAEDAMSERNVKYGNPGGENTTRPSDWDRQLRSILTMTPKDLRDKLVQHLSEPIENTLETTMYMNLALAHLSNTRVIKDEQDLNVIETIRSKSNRRALSLYEEEAVAFFIAETCAYIEVFILSTVELVEDIHPRIHSTYVETAVSKLKYAPGMFSFIDSSTIPSALPANMVPELLRDCYRILRPGGTIHLTFIDPFPMSSTCGPLLRQWFDEHLLLKLEMHFRCTNPTKLMPLWLLQSGLELIDTSTNPILPLPAVKMLPGLSPDDKPTKTMRKAHKPTTTKPATAKTTPSSPTPSNYWTSDDGIKTELGSICAQHLWKRSWASFVHDTPDTDCPADVVMWFDDADIVDECRTWGTLFDWRVLRGRKAEVLPVGYEGQKVGL